MHKLAWAFPLLLTACATVPPSGEGAFACRGDGLDRFKGALANIDIAREVQSVSGAGVVRWLGPRDIVTREFRADRVNINLDEALHTVVSVNCG